MCGIVGFSGTHAIEEVSRMMICLSGRGQQGSCIAPVLHDGSIDPKSKSGPVRRLIEALEYPADASHLTTGFLRYSTSGSRTSLNNIQPKIGNDGTGHQFTMCVNGDTVSIRGQSVSEYLRSAGERSILRGDSDTELLFHHIGETKGRDFIEKLGNAFCQVRGLGVFFQAPAMAT